MSRTVVHYTDAVAFGGAEQMLITLAGELGAYGWRSVLFHHRAEAGDRLSLAASRRGIETVSLPRRHGEVGVTALYPLIRELLRFRPVVFHAHLAWPLRCSLGLLASVFAHVRHRVATQQLFVPLATQRKRRRQRIAARMVHRYIAVSRAMAVQLESALPTETKVTVVHNGIELAPFDRPRDPLLRATLMSGADRPVVLSLARLEAQKGLDTLILAAEQVPDAIFVVAGEGAERERLQSEVVRRRVGERFHFIGHRADVPDLLAACDVFALPSHFEGLPVSVLEAMAARRPVVATAVPGTDEAVVDGVTGLLVPPADPSALAVALRRVTADDQLARELGTAGRARVEALFTARAMASGVESVYEELLGATRNAPALPSNPPGHRQAHASLF